MFSRPIFEFLPIVMMAIAVFIMAWFTAPWSFVTGISLVIASIYTLYKHYSESGTDRDMYDLFQASNKNNS